MMDSTDQERAEELVVRHETELRLARANARVAEEALRRARRVVANTSGALGEARKRCARMESRAELWFGKPR